MPPESRTEQDVVTALSDPERRLLKRVLEVERAHLHLTADDLTDKLVDAVKEILP